MHGLGNDFIIMDGRGRDIQDPGDLSRRVCDRHTGVGADGLIIVYPSDRADIRMAIYNSDGSEAQMCGNGIRSVAKYVFDKGMICRNEFTIESFGQIKYITVFPKNKKARDLLMRAPSVVTEKQLEDVHIKVDVKEK